MPVLEAEDKPAPRSILRHRPIGTGSGGQGQQPGATAPIAQRASRGRPQQTDVNNEEIAEWQRADDKKAAPRGRTTTAPRKTITTPKALPKTPRPAAGGKTVWRAHPLLYLGVGMLVMLALWTGLSMAVTWVHTTLDDMRYGRPRTFQIDAFVGHNETAGIPSHFIAINLNRRIEIIELPGGDASHARIYSGPQLYGPNDDLAPITLSFVDVNGDHKPDMLIRFQDSQIVFINDQGGFRPLRPGERPLVEQFLQQHGP